MEAPNVDAIDTDTMADTAPCVLTLTYPYPYSDTCEEAKCDSL